MSWSQAVNSRLKDKDFRFHDGHYVTIGFRALNWTSRETYKTGEINLIETTPLTRTETRHDILAHGDLLQASLYGRQG